MFGWIEDAFVAALGWQVGRALALIALVAVIAAVWGLAFYGLVCLAQGCPR